MKVIYFHQHFSTPNGSAGIRSYEMARRLLGQGHQVTMVCGSYGGGETGLTQPFVGGRRRGTVDGIHIIEFDLAYSNTDGFVKRVLTFVKFALRSIGLAFTEKYDVLLVLEWASYRSAHRLVGLSPGIVEGIAHRGVPRDRIAFVPNGCDLGIFAAEVQPWRPAKVLETDLMAVFAGTHGMANGLDAVLDSAAELKRRGRFDIKLVLIGQGKLKAGLQARVTREGLDNVVFHDPVSKAKLAGLMAATDLGLQILANVPAFYYGTSPNKFFDYIAAGLPVLNNYPGWLAEMITEHRCGFAVPPDNSVAFADALEQAAVDRDALKAMGQRGRALAETQFDRIKLADRWVDWVTGVKA